MIVKISGVYSGQSPRGILLESGGITYEIFLMSYTKEQFLTNQKIGEPVSLYTIYYIESNLAGGHMTPTLLGFTEEKEREFFQLFTSVAKIGVKTALTAASIPVDALAEAIEKGDSHTLQKLKGIGERTAHKIIASLRGKVAIFALASSGGAEEGFSSTDGTEMEDEAMQILLQLGHSMSEAKKMIKEAMANNTAKGTAEELLAEIYKSKA